MPGVIVFPQLPESSPQVVHSMQGDVNVTNDYDVVIGKHGSPFLLKENGDPYAFNPMFAPAVYASRNHVIHDALSRMFYEYVPTLGLWRVVTADSMRCNISDLLFDLGNHFKKPNIANKERSDAKLSGALNNLRAITDSRFDDRPSGFVHCTNGMLDVRTGKLQSFDPKFKSRNATPFQWDAGASCPRFLEDLMLPSLCPEDVEAIQLYAGMTLMGRNLAQKILLLTGTPGGGKSQLCNVIEGLIGRCNCTELRTTQLAERFELARFVGKTLLTGKDVPGNFLMTKGAHVLKALSGGDALETEVKGRMGSNTLEGEFCVIITSNSRLRVRLDGDNGAWRRRLLIINYNRPKTDRVIPDFGRHLLNIEGAGILRWAVEGARKLLEYDYQYPVTQAQQGRVDSLLDESDALRSFLGTKIQTSSCDNLATSEIVGAFFSFCDQKNWASCSVREVERQLPDAMMELHRASKSNSIERGCGSVKGFRGVRLIDEI